ncbi:MAG TPA: CAP domain-containing protein [Prolixibacteraceae bacterium]|nr:CAP domain-containing protein [Prolixibacteraceae bacterium]HCU62980.1 CAP domain-containing protein [Prolixibacteraceae bacterium]
MAIFNYFLIIIMLTSQSNWDNELNTARNLDYMSETEKAILFEINKVRSNPARYAKEYMETLGTYYDGNKLIYPGQPPIITTEGKRALNECIFLLKKTNPVTPLNPERGLYLAALDHVKDQRENGGIGHFGSDGSKPIDRIERYGTWDISAAENISYGIEDARQIVMSLLIDDGVPGRGHRENILNSTFTVTGISCDSHPGYGITCVMDFAGAYKSK